MKKLILLLALANIAPIASANPATSDDLILLTGIPWDSANGDQVMLRETGGEHCVYAGTFHDTSHEASSWIERVIVAGRSRLTDWSIELTRKRCNQTVQAFSAVIPLSSTHTYIDGGGMTRAGYGPGDSVAKMTPIQGLPH
ncbi:hypothetical protein [Paraburkholderia fungorum]|uniref:hypothetical protein n=1 Tax=Paraburkholderia fungorum TaxID=134537 RepID=UPI0016070014|nr:hypothetical protein [Paraburkholderia fungorum]MBB5547579.1 hypothetical protein [Paraburkholderia fungorum]